MTEQVQEQAPQQPDIGATVIPIALNLREIQGVLTFLRKFPMEQVEGLVMNIQGQANKVLASMQETNTEGEAQ